jgi:hypothetical protein
MPQRLDIAPGVAAAHDGHTVIILELVTGSEVRVRDVATGDEKSVPVSELAGVALDLSGDETRRRRESVRTSTREEWLRARRRERLPSTPIFEPRPDSCSRFCAVTSCQPLWAAA